MINNNTTQSKAQYIKLWYSHIDSLNILLWIVANTKNLRDSKTAQAYYKEVLK